MTFRSRHISASLTSCSLFSRSVFQAHKLSAFSLAYLLSHLQFKDNNNFDIAIKCVVKIL